MTDIIKVFRNPKITKLNLDHNNINGNHERVKVITDELKANKYVQILSMNYCKLCIDGPLYLSEALKINTTLTELHLVGNHIDNDGAKEISNILRENRKLTVLDLENNSIYDTGVRYIADTLKTNNTLIKLNLSHNPFQEEGFQSIADSMKENTTLTHLLLNKTYWNNGFKSFVEMIKVNKSLVKLEVYRFGRGGIDLSFIEDKLEKNKKHRLYIKKLLHLTGVLTNKNIRNRLYKNLLRQVILTNVINNIDISVKNRKYLLSFI